MALPEEPLSIVEQWKIKSYEMSSQSNDTIVSLLSTGIDTMAVVLNKKSDLNRVLRALVYLESERSHSLQFDDLKYDEVRSLVYGLIESLHFTLGELTRERNQVKDCGEMFTQTDQETAQPSLLSEQVKESVEMFTQTDKELSVPSLNPNPSNDYADQSRDDQSMFPNLLELSKEEQFHDISFKIEDLWGDAMEIKDEEMFVKTCNDNGDIAGDGRNITTILDNNDDLAQSEMPALNSMGDRAEFENENVEETMNDSKDNISMEEGREKDSSESVEVEKNRRSSRNVSRPMKFDYCESSDNSDDDSEPTAKKSNADLSTMKNKKSSGLIKKKSGSAISNRNSGEMKCIECEYQTTSTDSFIHHLRRKHSTTLALAGLALRCDCGIETVSNKHTYKCDIANFTVIRKRCGPIQTFSSKGKSRGLKCTECKYQTKSVDSFSVHLRKTHSTTLALAGLALRCDCGVETQSKHHKYRDKCDIANFTVIRRYNDEKMTPKCLLCDKYPKTAYGYTKHLKTYHKSFLSAHKIFLLCTCGAKYHGRKPDSKHSKECTRCEYTLHKIADK